MWLLGVIRGQPEGITWKCVGPSNVANATEHYAATGALVCSILELVVPFFQN